IEGAEVGDFGGVAVVVADGGAAGVGAGFFDQGGGGIDAGYDGAGFGDGAGEDALAAAEVEDAFVLFGREEGEGVGDDVLPVDFGPAGAQDAVVPVGGFFPGGAATAAVRARTWSRSRSLRWS